jgi:hypothetical protein
MCFRDAARRAGLGLLLLCAAWLVVENALLLGMCLWSRSWGALGAALPLLTTALVLTTTVTFAALASMMLVGRAMHTAGRRAWAGGRPHAGEASHE